MLDQFSNSVTYNYKEIKTNIPFNNISDVNLMYETNIVNTNTKKDYNILFSITPKILDQKTQTKEVLSYIILNFPNLCVDNNSLVLYYKKDNDYIEATIKVGAFRFLKRFKGIRIDQCVVKIIGSSNYTNWKLKISKPINRKKNIEIHSISLENQLYEGFIKRNMYTETEVALLKRKYKETFWTPDLIENGIQYEMRIQRQDENSEPKVTKLCRLEIDSSNKITVKKTRNKLLKKSVEHVAEQNYIQENSELLKTFCLETLFV
jgi:hypothetical protein